MLCIHAGTFDDGFEFRLGQNCRGVSIGRRRIIAPMVAIWDRSGQERVDRNRKISIALTID
jgi:hypothetical protein